LAKRPPSDHPAPALATGEPVEIEVHPLTAGKAAPMLHDPSHRPQPITTSEIKLQPAEKDVLRHLVAQLAPIATLPVHREKAGLWRRLNDLESARPMVWINEIP
jgi:hypothetical protein